MMVFCPKCGNVAYYNPYFGKDNCTVCKWLGHIERPWETPKPRPRRLTEREKQLVLESFS